ncbi:hypothetical protein U1Q18_037189 [Sarracenia purpurea var. burkii]
MNELHAARQTDLRRKQWTEKKLPTDASSTGATISGGGKPVQSDGEVLRRHRLSFQANGGELRSEAGTATTVAATNRREGSGEICGGEERKEFGEDFWFSLKVAGAEKKFFFFFAWTPVSVKRRRRNRVVIRCDAVHLRF